MPSQFGITFIHVLDVERWIGTPPSQSVPGLLLPHISVFPQKVLLTEQSYLVKAYDPFWGGSQRQPLVCGRDTGTLPLTSSVI